MAILHINLTSRSLTAKTDVYVGFPTPTLQDMIQHRDSYDSTKQWPVVYLLHGAGGDGFEWIQRTDIEALCCRFGFIAVIPNGELSFYCNTPDGRNYYDFIADELPRFIESTFRASSRPEDRYLMGYSMGGFGAVKIGLLNPERYHKIASLSGCMDVAGFIRAFEGSSIFNLHGNLPGWPDIEGTDNDMLHLLDTAIARRARGEYVPPIYHTIGKQDFIYAFSQEWRKKAQASALDFVYSEGEGAHDFDYWNPKIANELLPFFFDRNA